MRFWQKILARPAGLEPATRCLEGSRSPPPRWTLENSHQPRVSVCFHSDLSPPFPLSWSLVRLVELQTRDAGKVSVVCEDS